MSRFAPVAAFGRGIGRAGGGDRGGDQGIVGDPGRSAGGQRTAGRSADGQSTAELAILLPIVILVVLTVVQVGLVSRDYVVLHHAAREAARQAAVEPSRAGAVAGAQRASPVLDPDRLVVALTGSRSPGDLLVVEVNYRSPTLVPVVGRLVGDVELSTAAVVRVE